MSTIYVVVKESGSYSDYSKNLICAFYNENDAEIFMMAKNDEIALFKKAISQQYDHMNKWIIEDPTRDYNNYSAYNQWRELQDIVGHSFVNRYQPVIKAHLSPDQLKRFNELEVIIAEAKEKSAQCYQAYRQEEKDFVNSLEFLNTEQKVTFIEQRYRDADSNYIIEAIEIS